MTRAPASYEDVFQGIKTVYRSEEVRGQLLAAIEEGHLKPGDALPSERALAKMLGVSRMSVREAIRSLQAVGLLEVRHGAGSFVAGGGEERAARRTWLELYRGEVVDLLEVRGAVDEVVAEAAARRGDPASLVALRRVHAAFLEGVSTPGPDLGRLVELDIAFHDAVGEASGNRLAAHLLRDLNSHLNESRREALSFEGRPDASAKEHERILRAIVRGDAGRARAAAARHVRAVLGLMEQTREGR